MIEDAHQNNFAISLNLSLKTEVTKVFAFCNFSIPSDKNDRACSRVVLKRMVDICKVTTILSSIGKIMLEEVTKHADFEVKCPFKQVSFVSNF